MGLAEGLGLSLTWMLGEEGATRKLLDLCVKD